MYHYMYVCACVCVCMCMYVCVCMYVHTWTGKPLQTAIYVIGMYNWTDRATTLQMYVILPLFYPGI